MNGLNFKQRYEALAARLLPYAPCWNQSVLHFWPACRDAVPDDWWEALLSWPLEAIHALDAWIAGAAGMPGDGMVPPGLAAFVESCRPLLDFPKTPGSVSLANAQTLRMTAKKQHELGRILPFLIDRIPELGIQRAVDIGGGAGHLARTLADELALPLVSIDRDASLQAMGRQVLQKSGRPARLEFVNAEVLSGEQPELEAYFSGNCLSLGLHTCGPLAWAHLNKSMKGRGLLNFGCCYDRMVPGRDCQQSAFAQQHALPLTSFALFLATRGRYRSLPELALQQQVNSFRLALHAFLIEENLAEGFIGVGDAPRALYSQGFGAYAEDRLRYLGFDFAGSRQRAEDFVQQARVQRSMREFFVMNVVRNAFARPLEVTILLDRALWLEERGHAVEIREFFEHRISPRNLGIFARINYAAAQKS